MDAVILAAGHGKRLSSIVPQHYKPLIPVNGAPIVVSAVRQASRVRADRIIVVVSPHNALPICDLLSHVQLTAGQRLSIVVQPHATGPGDALLRGLEVVRADYTLVLMGDNVTPDRDLDVMCLKAPAGPTIGYRLLEPTRENERFTRKRPDGTWTEKEPIEDRDLWEMSDGLKIRAWIGPLIIRSDKARDMFTRIGRTSNTEVPIGPYIEAIAPDAKMFQVETQDIGTPDDFPSESPSKVQVYSNKQEEPFLEYYQP